MKNFLIAAVAGVSLMALGCEPEKENKAATPETDAAAEKVADKAVDVAQGVEKSVKGGADQAKQGVAADSAQAVGAETVQNNILDLLGKAKKSLEEKNFDQAQGFVQQAKDLKGKLPADAQVKIDAQLSELDKLIAAGKALLGPAGK